MQKSLISKTYYRENRERIVEAGKLYSKTYYPANKDKFRARARKYYAQNPEKYRELAKKFREEHRDYFLSYMRGAKHRESARRSYVKRREHVLAQAREYRATPARKRYMREWTAEKYYNDAAFNLRVKIRRRIYQALRAGFKGIRKSTTTIKLLGCSYGELKVHIESKFTDGMAWEDCFSGRIHLDHIRPCASFDLTDPEQQKTCFHYTNLQPLWAEDNLRKKDKWQEQESEKAA